MANTHVYTRKEEVVNAITHGVGVLLSIAALVFLIIFSAQTGSPWNVVISVIYGVSMLLLYVSSTLAIYIFIAGTYTPIMLLVIKGSLGWTLLGIIWGVAIIGVVFKAFYVKKFLFLSTILYIAMGWMIVIVWGPLTATMPAAGIQLLIAGGLLYTFGAIFYVWRGFPFHHAVWHVFVLGGTATHFFAVLFYILPQ
jgi:hemolysin III